jgi:hypothetical protein
MFGPLRQVLVESDGKQHRGVLRQGDIRLSSARVTAATQLPIATLRAPRAAIKGFGQTMALL